MLRILTFRSKYNIDSNSLIKAYGLDEYGIIDCLPNGLWFITGTTPVVYTDYVPVELDTTKYEFICITPTFFRWRLNDDRDEEIRNIPHDDRDGEIRHIQHKDNPFINAFHYLNSLIK